MKQNEGIYIRDQKYYSNQFSEINHQIQIAGILDTKVKFENDNISLLSQKTNIKTMNTLLIPS